MPRRQIGAKHANFSQLYAAARFSLSPYKLAMEVTRLLCIPDCCTSRGLKHCHTSFEAICAALDEVFEQCRENPDCAVSNRLAAAVIRIYGNMGADSVLRNRIFSETDFLTKAISLLHYPRPGETVMQVLSDVTHSHDLPILLEISRFTSTILDAVEDLTAVSLNYAEKAVCVLSHITVIAFLDAHPDNEIVNTFPRLLRCSLSALRLPSSSSPAAFLANPEAVDFLIACTRCRDICIRIFAQRTLIEIYSTQVEARTISPQENPVLVRVQARAPQLLEEYYQNSPTFSATHFDGVDKLKALTDAFKLNPDRGLLELGVELAKLLSDQAILILQYKMDLEGGKDNLIEMLQVCENAARDSSEADADLTADTLHLLRLLTHENGRDAYTFGRTCVERHLAVAFFYYVVAICGNLGFDCIRFADKGLECSGMSDFLHKGLLQYHASASLERVAAMADGVPDRVRFGEMNVLLEKAARSAKTFIDIAPLDDLHMPVMYGVAGLLTLAANGHTWRDVDFQTAKDQFSLICDIARCTSTSFEPTKQWITLAHIFVRMSAAWEVWGRTVSRQPNKQYSTEVRPIVGPEFGPVTGDSDSELDHTANLAALLEKLDILYGPVQPGVGRYGTAQLHRCAACNRPGATLRKCAGCRRVSHLHFHPTATMPSSATDPALDSPVTPDLHLASSDPLVWEKQWEQRYQFTVVTNRSRPESLCHERWLLHEAGTRFRDPENQDHMIRSIRSLKQALCYIQAQMTLKAAPFCVGNELRRRWMSASPARRGEIILAGLVSTCTSVPDLHGARCLTIKEMSVESHRHNGSMFPDLLEEMMVQNFNPTSRLADTPNYISHPVWVAIAAEQQSPKTTVPEKLALAKLLVQRNLLIGSVVHFALCSFLDLPPPEKLVQLKTGKPQKPRLEPSQGLSKLHGENSEVVKSAAKAALVIRKKAYARNKEIYASEKKDCQTCGKLNDTTTKFPRCRRCWDTMHREVFYCSTFLSECQKMDWKAGHKKECGKFLQFEELTPSAPEEPSLRIGPPLSGFKRSGALVFQVAQLNHLSPDYDYLIFHKRDRAYLSFQDPPIRAAFCACRDKAVTTGDRRAVAMLAQFLRFVCSQDSRPQKFGVGPDGMMEQLSIEFDFPEIARAADEMEQQMLSDSAHRPPLIVDAGVSVEQWKAISATWADSNQSLVGTFARKVFHAVTTGWSEPTTWVDVGVIPVTDGSSIYSIYDA
ncbi:hypothetical protein FB45DRAFT_1063214 [Roridomyces roridus]|uniref:MYND-type domain-containing protein n=1 Tax=Roridomyces roridus TaxID=1738132 RepID=A0AAD7FH83_9AGAR|nr:hypothetical protein FB45DRAFT_1063214 [Roridomyces roridus]